MSFLGRILDAIRDTGEFGPTRLAIALDVLEGKLSEPLDWRNSIVDLLKLVKVDHSLANRKALAREMGYTGDFGEAAMNIWLHEHVMRNLAKNRGTMPDRST